MWFKIFVYVDKHHCQSIHRHHFIKSLKIGLDLYSQNVVGAGQNRAISPEDRSEPKDEPAPAGGAESETTDTSTSGDGGAPEFTKRMRVHNINENDKENIPYTLPVMWGLYIVGVLTEDGHPCLDVLFICTLIWLLARVSHAVCYLYGVQPWRSRSWAVGQLAALAMATTLIIGSFLVRFGETGCNYCDSYKR